MTLPPSDPNELFARAATVRAALAHDPHRPRYHFLPPANWMNDPNGLLQWKGRYHMFYQYNPAGPFWGDIHWGHAVSSDLVHWDDLPIALAPDPAGPDADGCFSGCAVDSDGTPTLIYTGVRGAAQLACIATSDDDLRHWTKYAGNPVIAAPPPELDLVAYRDHSVWREDGQWYQVVGSGIRDVGATALLYRSDDLRHWQYLHPLLTEDVTRRDAVWSGTMWECPQFFRFADGQGALVACAWDDDPYYTIAVTGAYGDQQLSIATRQKIDYGNQFFYAPQALREDSGRYLMWGWIQEGRSAAAQRAAGWSGVMSLPRVVTLVPGEGLRFTPAPEIDVLRGAHQHLADVTVTPGMHIFDTLAGDTLDLELRLEPGDASQIGIVLRATPDADEYTLVGYDCQQGLLFLDATHASRDPEAAGDRRSGPLALAAGEPLQLRIFLDRSVIEVFANGRACITGRSYPLSQDSQRLGTFAVGGMGRVVRLDAWEMQSIWKTVS